MEQSNIDTHKTINVGHAESIHDDSKSTNSYMNSSSHECSVCLQTCIHPVELPCKHVFCFLCVKGAANRSKRCALCRQEIPQDYFNKPKLLENLNPDDVQFDDGYQWFYEGRNGWWQYDERTSIELEDFFKQNNKTVEMLVAGFLYVIDFENMIQYRRNDPTRRRRVKRDLITSTARKGVAGLKVDRPNVLAGSETVTDDSSSENHASNNISVDTETVETMATRSDNVGRSLLHVSVPNNTPQTSVNNSSTESSPRSSRHGDVEELAALVEAVNLSSDSAVVVVHSFMVDPSAVQGDQNTE